MDSLDIAVRKILNESRLDPALTVEFITEVKRRGFGFDIVGEILRRLLYQDFFKSRKERDFAQRILHQMTQQQLTG